LFEIAVIAIPINVKDYLTKDDYLSLAALDTVAMPKAFVRLLDHPPPRIVKTVGTNSVARLYPTPINATLKLENL
jgi:hypothetical protein